MATEVEVVNGLGLDTIVDTVVSPHQLNGDVANGTVDSSSASTTSIDEASIATTSTSSSAPVAVSATPAALPTYDDIFPALPGGLGGPQPMSAAGPGGPALGGAMSAASRISGARAMAGSVQPKIRSTNVQIRYRVAPEERRAGNRNRFGETSELGKICQDIMRQTGTDIQLTTSRDGTLNFLISGKEDSTVTVSQCELLLFTI